MKETWKMLLGAILILMVSQKPGLMTHVGKKSVNENFAQEVSQGQIKDIRDAK